MVERVERRLTVIVSADVVGYSRLIEVDEAGTRTALNAHRRELIDPGIAEFGGRVVNTAGDGLLIEFESAVQAVQCTLQLQRELKEHNADVPEARRIVFRIGVNLGEVIVEGDDIHGDGVNIAARLQEIAKPGGVCISGKVFEEVGRRLDAEFDALGEQKVKNIARPIPAYSVRKVGNEHDNSGETQETSSSHSRPSIAVLPFDNMSGDPEQEYFSDGISEDITTALSKLSTLFVIARNSSFAYKGKVINVKDVCSDLGVRYLLEGSVRKAGDRIRVTAQLVDGSTGGHLWAERFDRELTDIFDLQDEITAEIVSMLEVKLTPSQRTLLNQKDTTSAEAHDFLLRGRDLQYRHTKETNQQAREMFERAAALDPVSAVAVASIGHTYLIEMLLYGPNRKEALLRAGEYAKEALSLDDSVGLAHLLMGQVLLYRGLHDQAITEMDHAVALEPSDPRNYLAKSWALTYMGRPREALEALAVAKRLDPRFPPGGLLVEGIASIAMENWSHAISALQRCVALDPELLPAHMNLAASLAMTDRAEEAAEAIARVLRLDPNFTVAVLQHRLERFYKNPLDLKPFIIAVRKAGLPE